MKSIRKELEKLPATHYDNFDHVLLSNRKKARERNNNLGEGMKKGKIVFFPVADERAWYEIIKVGDRVSRLRYVPELSPNNYKSNEVDEDGIILTSNLEKAVESTDEEFSYYY